MSTVSAGRQSTTASDTVGTGGFRLDLRRDDEDRIVRRTPPGCRTAALPS
jgi:hypothetical protein